MNHSSPSYLKKTFLKLTRNIGAMAGLIIIVTSSLMAVFAYFIASDATPNADRQIVEIQARKPGFTQLFLRINKEKKVASPSFFSRLLFGIEDNTIFVPANSFKETADSVIIEKYIDENIEERQAYSKKILPAKNYIVSKTFWLGTDKFGRDILSRLIVGVRVSLAVGLIAVIISLAIGVFLGAFAGYFGGATDKIIMWFINVTWSMPTLLLVFGITLALGKNFWFIFIAVGLTMWVNIARVVRGQVLSIREMEYVQSAKALGLGDIRIILRHILPNIIGPVIVIATSNFATAIIIEAGLSFLGAGVQPPTPSWGLMIKENYNFIITHNPSLALAPGIAIMILVLAFNLLGNGLRDAFDVKS